MNFRAFYKVKFNSYLFLFLFLIARDVAYLYFVINIFVFNNSKIMNVSLEFNGFNFYF